MATITRRLASHLRAVCRRAFGNRGPYPNLSVSTSPDGLAVRVKSADVAVEYRGGEGGPEDQLWVPFQTLLDCEAKKDEPVRLEAAARNRTTAYWQDGGVPQIVNYEVTKPAEKDKFPDPAENFVSNPSALLDAFKAASETIDPESVRFALGRVQVRGKSGSLVATDGRQCLVQSGFTFPWEEDILVPKTQVLTCPEFNTDRPIEVGKAGDWIAFRIGEWTVWLAINKDGRFPDVLRHVPRVPDATASCRLSPADGAIPGGESATVAIERSSVQPRHAGSERQHRDPGEARRPGPHHRVDPA